MCGSAPPQIPYVSDVTGTWITNDQAIDPAYWTRQLCETVRFSHGLGHLLREDSLLVEVGPGQSLCSFTETLSSGGAVRGVTAVPTLRSAYQQQSSLAFLLGTLGR